MEITKKEVVTSSLFDFVDLPSIHEYGTETFGIRLADNFITEIYSNLDCLTILSSASRMSASEDQN